MNTLVSICESYLMEQNLLVGCGISNGTFVTYKVRLNFLKRFLVENSLIDIDISEFKLSHLLKYEIYIKTLGNSSNDYAMKLIQFIGRVYDYAMTNDLVSQNPCKHFNYRYNRQMKKNYITLHELKKIETYIAPKGREYSYLERTKDLFLFCTYTGLSFSDMINFNYRDHCFIKEDIEWIKIKRQKTSSETLLPLLPKAKEILIKYDNNLPKTSNHYFNNKLKQLSRELNIKTPLCSHSARKTFGMIMHNDYGVPIDTVSKMLGHSRIVTTQKWYVKTDEGKIISDMGQVLDKLNNST